VRKGDVSIAKYLGQSQNFIPGCPYLRLLGNIFSHNNPQSLGAKYLMAKGEGSIEMNKEKLSNTGITLTLFAAGIGMALIANKCLKIEGDAVFIVLVILPFFVYLTLTGKLKQFSLFGASMGFVEEVKDKVISQVDKVGGYEEERSKYLGKLRQVLEKDGTEFCLIYADVDDLRQKTRKIYLKQGATRPKSGDFSKVSRRTEEEIRAGIIKQLGLALTDAFYKAKNIDEKAKQDIFFLQEPDVAMIARKVTSERAKEIAKEGITFFAQRGAKDEQTGDDKYEAKVAVLAAGKIKGEPTPQKLDEEAANKLRALKNQKEAK